MTAKDLFQRYISINLSDYSNINVDLEINKIVLLILLGLLISTVVISYKRAIIIRVAKKLLRHEALDEQSAVTLDAIHLNSFFVKREIEGETRLHRLVGVKGEKDLSYEEYVSKSKSKEEKREESENKERAFYIRGERLDEVKKIASQKDITALNTLLLCILYVIVFVSIVFLMPEILTIVNKLL